MLALPVRGFGLRVAGARQRRAARRSAALGSVLRGVSVAPSASASPPAGTRPACSPPRAPRRQSTARRRPPTQQAAWSLLPRPHGSRTTRGGASGGSASPCGSRGRRRTSTACARRTTPTTPTRATRRSRWSQSRTGWRGTSTPGRAHARASPRPSWCSSGRSAAAFPYSPLQSAGGTRATGAGGRPARRRPRPTAGTPPTPSPRLDISICTPPVHRRCWNRAMAEIRTSP